MPIRNSANVGAFSKILLEPSIGNTSEPVTVHIIQDTDKSFVYYPPMDWKEDAPDVASYLGGTGQ